MTETKTPELSVDDFKFDGPLGSQGTTIKKIARNHFKVTLGAAPGHPEWNNKLQFQITRNARGNAPRLDVVFLGGEEMRFNEYFYSWSYDGHDWNPVQWQYHSTDSLKGDTLLFPDFEQDVVYVGHQVPLSYEDLQELVKQWQQSPHVKVHRIGQSLEKRDLFRIEITDAQSTIERSKRWVYYVANQHPGEHNSQWRMVGMMDWLLSEAGADCRRRSICHFVLMMSPDGPSHGWYRNNAQGIDMNRSYLPEGSDPARQPHEAYLAQKDLEQLMASEAPVTINWSMHTWGGIVEPIIYPGPEMQGELGSWEKLRDIIENHNKPNLIKTLRMSEGSTLASSWGNAPKRQFGITSVLCEGSGGIYTKAENLKSGEILMQSLAAYYKGTRTRS
jgi:hypothetical protein